MSTPQIHDHAVANPIDDEVFEQRTEVLRRTLLSQQQALLQTRRGVVVLIHGPEGAGKSAVINRLKSWFDARDMRVHAFTTPTEDERARPHHWRYWLSLPARGRIALLYGAWYDQPMIQRLQHRLSEQHFQDALRDTIALEHMLAADNYLVVKVWLQISETTQTARTSAALAQGTPVWQVTSGQQLQLKRYGEYQTIGQHVIDSTHRPHAPWTVICAEDANARDLAVGEYLRQRFQDALEHPAVPAPLPLPDHAPHGALESAPFLKALTKQDYRARLPAAQTRLARLAWQAYEAKRSIVLVFEGWDAAGKGGAIYRINDAIDARLCTTIAVGAPTDEELAHHYLWRFWRHLPRAGHVTIYDRSWYGRVLVERVEHLIPEHRWQDAYSEINTFEHQLHERGCIVVKCFLHISKDEQRDRLKEREKVDYKRHKVGEADWRNFKLRSTYQGAMDDMLRYTHTPHAHWKVIASDNKKQARVTALDYIADQIERALQ